MMIELYHIDLDTFLFTLTESKISITKFINNFNFTY